jgi:hypothetical protein
MTSIEEPLSISNERPEPGLFKKLDGFLKPVLALYLAFPNRMHLPTF